MAKGYWITFYRFRTQRHLRSTPNWVGLQSKPGEGSFSHGTQRRRFTRQGNSSER